MDKKQVGKNIENLLKRRAAIASLAKVERENALINSGSQVTGDVGDTDLGTTMGEQDVSLTLLNMENVELKKIDSALGRARDGNYGICAVCQQPIDSKRLALIPEAACCTACEPAAGG